MNKNGLRIAQPGYNALTDPKERMVFDSKYDTMKLYMSGSGSANVAAADIGTSTPGMYTVTIAHNLSYKPAFMVFCTSNWRSNDKLSPYAFRSVGAISPDGAAYAVDDTNLYIHLFNGDPSNAHTMYYRYHIYYNELV